MNLTEKLSNFSSSLSNEEYDNFKLFLSTAARGLAYFSLENEPKNNIKKQAFSTLCKCIASTEKSGIIWRGKPDFLNSDILAKLEKEAYDNRKNGHPVQRCFLSKAGEVAQELINNNILTDFVSRFIKYPVHTSGPFYIYYDVEGCGVDPHVDREIFNIGLIINIYHKYTSTPSRLILYLPDGKTEYIHLIAGETILFYTGGTIHSRENTTKDELICSLLVGFQSKDNSIQ